MMVISKTNLGILTPGIQFDSPRQNSYPKTEKEKNCPQAKITIAAFLP
jgi:hypothetical protein